MNVMVWMMVLGLLAGGYFVLAGYDYGIGALVASPSRDEPRRRVLIGAFAPFFLGNEVWLLAVVGVLLGVFPEGESALFTGGYPVLLAAVTGVLLVLGAVQLRGRVPGRRHRFWDALISGGSVLAGLGWGVLLGDVLGGLAIDARGRPSGSYWSLLGPYPLLAGLTMLALFLLHGSAFLLLRVDGDEAAAARRRVGRLTVVVALLAVLAVTAAVLSGTVRAAVHQPLGALAGIAVLAVALLGVRSAVRRDAARLTFAWSSLAVVAPLLATGLALYPDLLAGTGGGLPAAALLSAGAAPLGWFAMSVLPVVLLVQWLSWRLARSGHDGLLPPIYF